MIVKNAAMENFHAALAIVNARYDGNIKFKQLEPTGRRIKFNLTVCRTSEGTGKNKVTLPGVSIKRGKRIAAACWHVHGDFFDALFDLAPDAEIFSAMTGIWEKKGDPWKDYEVGTGFEPLKASQACNCRRNYRTERILAAQANQGGI